MTLILLTVIIRQKKKVFGSYYVLKNIGRVGRDFFFFFFLNYFYPLTPLTPTIPLSWMASIKVCLVVIVFICIYCTSVHPEIDNLMVRELIFREACQYWSKNS